MRIKKGIRILNNESGNLMLVLIISTLIMSAIAISSASISHLNSTKKKSRHRALVKKINDEIKHLLNGKVSWAQTIASPSNVASEVLNCLSDVRGAAVCNMAPDYDTVKPGYQRPPVSTLPMAPIVLYSGGTVAGAPEVFYDGSDTLSGFDLSGQPCTAADANDETCPLKFTFTTSLECQSATCPVTEWVKMYVGGIFTTRPATGSEIRLNLGNYTFEIEKSGVIEMNQSYCALIGGEWDALAVPPTCKLKVKEFVDLVGIGCATGQVLRGIVGGAPDCVNKE